MSAPIVQDTKDGALLSVHVQPNASKTDYAGIHGAALKIRVAAPPVEGAANDAVVEWLADQLSIPCARVSIHSGAGSRRKRVLVNGLTAEQVRAGLRLPAQEGTVTR